MVLSFVSISQLVLLYILQTNITHCMQ